MSVSVIIITRNEEANIARCLASVSWADEIVVVDSGSSDRTVEIARGFTPLVFSEAWRGFGPQKALALSRATRDWVLSLDADEWVTDELAAELHAIAAAPAAAEAYRLPRRSSFCGRFLKHSGWWPDYVIRFFRRGAAEFSADLVHERLIVKGRTATLQHPLLHESHRSPEHALEKINLYSTLAAREMHAQGRRASLVAATVKALWAFFATYVLRAGFLDGREGFLVAVATAEGTFYRYVKLVYLGKETR